MLFPRMPQESKEEPIVARVTIARLLRTPPPKPSPTPTPAPLKTMTPSLVAAGKHARVEPIKHVGSKRPAPPKVRMATPDASVPTGGQGAGAQNGEGAGSTSTVNGNGSGTGNEGAGNGSAICGAVYFESSEDPTYDAATGLWEHRNIIAVVGYSDGSEERIPIDWVWYYKHEADDPLRPGSTAPMLFQFPPAAERASEPPAIQYIIAHTTPTGHTRLLDCGNVPPPPATPAPGHA